MSAYDFVRDAAFALDKGVLAHLLVLNVFGTDFADGDASADGEAVVGVEHGVMQFGAEITAEGNEGMEDGVVADHPWGEAGEEECACYGCF